MRVLFVEDSPADARLLRETVADGVASPLDLHHVTNIAAAEAALTSDTFDSALLDLNLPDADGMSGLITLQELAPELPVVVLTGREDPAFAARMVQDGAQDYLLKSDVTGRTLERVLRHAVERKRIESELRATSRQLEATVAQVVQQRRSLALLNEMSRVLQVLASVDEAIERAATYLPHLLPGTAGFLEARPGAARSSWGAPPSPDSEGLQSIPLRAQGREVGVLRLEGNADDELLWALARQLGFSLYTIGLHDDLFQQSVRDPLTGIFNRRYLVETLRRELRRALRSQRPLSLLFVDVDHFKEVNDRWGHLAGDKVLTAIADLLAASFRTEDVVSRYGGEEFIVALPDASLEDSLRRAHHLCGAVAHLDFEGHSQIGPVTVSIGVATFPEHGAELETLIAAADSALYRAKEAGRNRVMEARRQG